MTTALEVGEGSAFTPRPLFPPRKVPLPNVQEAGWTPGQVWTGAENLAPTGIRSPDRPARSQFANPTTLPGPQSCKYVPFNLDFPVCPSIILFVRPQPLDN